MSSFERSPPDSPGWGDYLENYEGLPSMPRCSPADYSSSLLTLKSSIIPLLPERACTYFEQSSYIPPAIGIPPLITGHWRHNDATTTLSYDDDESFNQTRDKLDFHSREMQALNSSSERVFSATPLPGRLDVGDETSILEEPSRHIDYLSNEWREEEDILASWKYVVARRRMYSDGVRLENASWRMWAKMKNKLRTLPCEAVNWFKDDDMTWLYGPFKTYRTQLVSDPCLTSRHSSSGIVLNKKPILRRRTASEVIRQGLHKFPQNRSVHFNDEVLQCIAVEGQGSVEDDYAQWSPFPFDPDNESDDDILVMKPPLSGTHIRNIITSRVSLAGEKKTIAPLPPTTLNHRQETSRFTTTEQKREEHDCWNLTPTSYAAVRRVPESPVSNFVVDHGNPNFELYGQTERVSHDLPCEHQASVRPKNDGKLAYDDNIPPLSFNNNLIPRVEEDLLHTGSDLSGKIMRIVITVKDLVYFICNTVLCW